MYAQKTQVSNAEYLLGLIDMGFVDVMYTEILPEIAFPRLFI